IVGGVTVDQHIRGMARTVVPAFLVALAFFLIMGLSANTSAGASTKAAAEDALASVFNISPICLLPLLLLVVLSLLRVPHFIAIFGTAVLSCAFAPFTQPAVVQS